MTEHEPAGLTVAREADSLSTARAVARALTAGPLGASFEASLTALASAGIHAGALYLLRGGMLRPVAGSPSQAELRLAGDLVAELRATGHAEEGGHRYLALIDEDGFAGALELADADAADPELLELVGSLFSLALRRDGVAELERRLVDSGKATAVGELAAGLAHELNNPLFAMLGLVEFLLEEVEPGTKARQRLELVQQSGQEIRELLRLLLAFTREREDELGTVDLADAARAAVALARLTSPARDVEVVERIDAGPVLVEGSANRLKQVLLHLLTNAYQAMPRGGSITVSTFRDGPWAVVTVEDTGPGVSEEFRARVFEPFFSTRHGLGGNGLGLTVARAIARMHGGDLTAGRASGGGAQLELRLPALEEAGGAA